MIGGDQPRGNLISVLSLKANSFIYLIKQNILDTCKAVEVQATNY